MKTCGLIWPDGRKELQSLVFDEDNNPVFDAIAPRPLPDDWQAPQIVPLIKIPKPDQGAWEPNLVWFADRVERQWVAGTPAPAPTFTAEQIVSQYFSPYQIQALARLEMALLAANKPLGPQMTSAKTWLEGVMLGWAVDPTPKPAAAFGEPSVTFEAASAEAVAGLQQNPET